jgi:aspartokinase-like uncharacterized kinase
MEAIVKVGGSLASDPNILRILAERIAELEKKHNLIVIPGGGDFADVVRAFDQRFTLSDKVSHNMAILGMDQFGLLLSDVIPNSRTFRELESIKQILKLRTVPVMLPSKLMFKKNPLPHSWAVTSDSIAAYFAIKLQTTNLILITDVDGVFTKDPKEFSDAKLFARVTIEELFKMNRRTSVDTYLPQLLLKEHMNCFVVNGRYPERLEAILSARKTVCTQIIPKTK